MAKESQESTAVLDYITNQWLPKKEVFIKAYTNGIHHLGRHSTSIAEGSHAALKQYIQTLTGDLLQVFERIELKLDEVSMNIPL